MGPERRVWFPQTSRALRILSPPANLVTANRGGGGPTAGTWTILCYTKTRVVTMFPITDLASIH